MDDGSQVPVPRSLRVGGTVQLLGKRVPIKTAIVGFVLIVLWAMSSFAGGDLFVTGQVLLAVGVVLSLMVEGRWDGGYDTSTVLRDLVRVLREPRFLEWQVQSIDVPTERAVRQSVVIGRPRWHITREQSQENVS